MQVADRMESIPFSEIRKIFEEVVRREKQGQSIIHMEIGRPDFDTPQHIKAAAKKALDDGLVHYSSNYGLMELREAIAGKFNRDNGIDYNPKNEILVTLGVTEGLFLSMMALMNHGDEILVPTPCFPHYIYSARMAGAHVVPVPLQENNNFNLNIDDIKSRLTPKTRMIIINTPGNPTGAIFTKDALNAVAELAREHDLYVLSDEIYEKMIYENNRHISIAGLPGMRERTITLNGFSKNYAMTGWRLGYAASSSQVISAMVRIHQYATVCPVTFAQWGAIEALNGPQDCVDEMVKEFDRRRILVTQRLQGMDTISLVPPKGAFYALPNVSGIEKTPQELAAYLLDEAGISVVPWGKCHIRLSYANSYENLEKAMDNMAAALKKL